MTAAAQASSNVDTANASARLAAVNQNSPYGSVKYDTIGTQNIGGNQVPQYQQTISLSPEQQNLYDKTTGLEGQALDTANTSFTNAQGSLNQPFNFGDVPGLQTSIPGGNIQQGYNVTQPQSSIANAGPIQTGLDRSNLPALPGVNDFSAERQRVEDAYLGRFNTDIGRQQNDVESRLNAQGTQQGSEAWNQAQDTLNRERVDARNAAIQAGGAEQSRLFGLASDARGQMFGENAASGNFANQAQGQQFGQNNVMADFYNQAAQQQTANNQGLAAFGNAAQQQDFGQGQANAALNNQGRQQGISEAQLLRSQPINELATLLGLGSNVQTPTGAPNFGIQVGNTDVLGAYGMQQAGLMNNYNQQMGAKNALMGAIGSAAGAAGGMAMMSDARLKNVIRQIGISISGIPIYLYRWKKTGELAIGVLAQEVEKVMPDAVHEIRGVKHVDYTRV